ncbi:PfaD family polyunsaturated fatty acid/polyketide biosynthesis protein [Paenibacillus hodogayensis]
MGEDGALGLGVGGSLNSSSASVSVSVYPTVAVLPAMYPEWLGDRSFLNVHRVRFAYIAGEMANGIATTQMVIAMARSGMLGFFGAGGLSPARIEQAIIEIQSALDPEGLSWGINLIHSPNEPLMEEKTVDLFLRRGVVRVSASAFMGLTPAVVRYACSGLHLDAAGTIRRKHYLFAKVSRPEVAKHFMSPPPARMLEALLAKGLLSEEEVRLAAHLPLAEDITVESDSGGHTDNRPLAALFPTILGLRNELMRSFAYTRPIRVGASGGIGTPTAAAAAFALGAAYMMTGSVNQSAIESGLSAEGKKMLAAADLADVIMAPAGDMFEQGVKVQVLKRGTLFSSRGFKLQELYRAYRSLEDIPREEILKLEKEVFQEKLEHIWQDTQQFFQNRDPGQLAKALKDPKHKMALIFRWYLGKASRWAIEGTEHRRLDYQIWCGPAMGAFNAWVKGTSWSLPTGERSCKLHSIYWKVRPFLQERSK